MELREQTAQRRNRAAILTDVRGALVRVLERKPFNDVTVDELAREAGLSRTAFYFYYRHKNEVLAAVVEEVSDTAHELASAWWSGKGSPEVMVRETLRGTGALWQAHSCVLRAAVEVAAHDPDFAKVYNGLMENFIAATRDHLRREQQAGKLRSGVDPDLRAEALVWMSERCHYIGLRSGRPPEETAQTLTGIWMNALYPDEAPLPG